MLSAGVLVRRAIGVRPVSWATCRLPRSARGHNQGPVVGWNRPVSIHKETVRRAAVLTFNCTKHYMHCCGAESSGQSKLVGPAS